MLLLSSLLPWPSLPEPVGPMPKAQGAGNLSETTFGSYLGEKKKVENITASHLGKTRKV